MKRCGPYLSLEVPGLAEGRPSLLIGDRAIICEPGKLGRALLCTNKVTLSLSPSGGDETCLHWEGYIHEVRKVGHACYLKWTTMGIFYKGHHYEI